jgi:hypothetical protein
MVDDEKYDDDGGDEPDAGEDPGGEGEPDGLPGGRIPAPPIPRDEWVENVIDDPSSNVQPVLLQGYVGDAAEEDYTRIYPNASLDSYVDVRNEDVLYHVPLEGDHAPRGGSMVWVRGDAKVSQGTGGGPAAAGADFFTGPVLAQNRQAGAAGAAQPGAQVHITLLTVAGCITRWNCPGNTAATLCTHRIICSHVCQQPGGGVGPGWGGVGGLDIDATTGCPPSVADTCPTKPSPCKPFEFPTDRWQPQLMRAAGNVGPTGWQGCGQGAGGEQGPIGVTGWQGCGHRPIGLTGWLGCEQPTHLLGCTGATAVTVCICGPGPVSMHPGCPSPEIGGAGGGHPGTIGFTGWLHCGHTLATVCTFHCPPPPLTMGGICGPGPVMTVVAHCPSAVDACPTRLCGGGGGEQVNPQPMMAGGAAGGGPIGPTGWQGCGQPHISLPGCIHTGTCPQAEAVTGPGSTIATVCTQIGCPHTGVANCSIATVCTQIGCHTAPQHCIPSLSGCSNTAATVCTQIGCPVGGAQGGPIGPTGWQGCGQPHISLPGCIQTGSCPQAEAGPIGVTGWLGCQPTRLIGCTGYLGCGQPHISLPGCIHTGTCPQGGGGGPMLGAQKAEAPGAAAAPTGQYIPQCPTFGFTCTVFCQAQGGAGGGAQDAVTGPDSTIATVCTQYGCRHTGYGCPRTRTCPPTYTPGCGPETEHGGSTAATLCTQAPFCPLTFQCLPVTMTPGCGPEQAAGPAGTAATVCTQYGCGHPGGTAATVCTHYGCGGTGGGEQMMAAAPQGAAGIPTGQYSPACPSFGFTCTYIHCPPNPVPGGTMATVCTQVGCGGGGGSTMLGCPRTIDCPPTYMPGCGGTGGAQLGAAPTYHQGCPTFGFTCTQFC